MRMDEPSDSDLSAALRRDPEALGVLYERHGAAVYRYLSRRVGAQAASDLLSDVFIAALTARLRVVGHASRSALPWLYGIAGNVVRNHLRRRPTVARGELTSTVDWDAVDARLDATARAPELRAALAGLSVEDRELLLLLAWEQLTPAQAASALRISPAAARSRIHRARTRAQARLAATTGETQLREMTQP
jgi:RNA polymerase sigma factor (sigma-70 family)